MRVEIISINAAVVGDRDSITWTGEVDIDPSGQAVDAVNELLFRAFNRVEDRDDARLADLGYFLPSLSVGDLVHWGGYTYRVAGMGFEPMQGQVRDLI